MKNSTSRPNFSMVLFTVISMATLLPKPSFAEIDDDVAEYCSKSDVTINVSSGDVEGLVDAINTANSVGDAIINLEPGTYTLTSINNDTNGFNGLPSITAKVCLSGRNADTTIITRDISEQEFRIFHISESGQLVINKLTVSRGLVPDGTGDARGGGGILNNGGRVIINQSSLSGSAYFDSVIGVRLGGAIWNHGSLAVRSSSVGGYVDGNGGAIYSAGGTVSITKSNISSSSAFINCGGISNEAGTMRITGSSVSGNNSLDAGGGICNDGVLTIRDSTIDGNVADDVVGGGIANSGELKISNSTIANNSASGEIAGGGGIANFGSGSLTIANTTISGNDGGSQEGGGGILGAATLVNSIVANNRGWSAPDCLPNSFGEGITSLGNNLIGDPTGCNIALLPTDFTGDSGLDAFIADGTPGNGHFPLLADSQAIDAGNNDACPPTDQLGRSRVDGDNDGSIICDIGSIEMQFDVLVCDPNTPGAIIGTSGDDGLIGTPGDDVIIGLEGNDRIVGLGGNDCIAGGAGADSIIAGAGNDEVDGGNGNDRIIAGRGDDRVVAGEGDDTIIAGSGNDEVDGGPGNDRIIGGPGTDTCVNGERVIQCELN